jgi:23S rRNA (cytidine1920-2'-O)/16S rRNA (cytidine1409-2'-O)-methyltransferase
VKRVRIDLALVERGIFPSRERAQAAILAGDVRVEGAPVRKASELVGLEVDISVAPRRRFVSRGGEKLAGALARFGVQVEGRSAIDVGASTGGFSDCLLQEGAQSVVALDVGYGQLAWSLRVDERVTVIERTNIRHTEPSELGAPFDIVVVDVSFISLRTVLPHLEPLLGAEGDLLALVKPQFEVGKGRVGKRGVVRDPGDHMEVLQSAMQAAEGSELVVRGLTYSPITGPEGNIEFWMWLTRNGETAEIDVERVVSSAHFGLGG